MTDYPFISCLCPTFGRTHLLEEAIQSFLSQTYPGRKELIVLNDFDQQRLVFDHPEVRVINAKERYPSLGQKRNASVDFSQGDLLCVWDDDDIALPWYLLRLYTSHAANTDCTGVIDSHFFYSLGDNPLNPTKRLCYASMLYPRQIFREAGGYKPINFAEDKLIVKDLGIKTHVHNSISYIYRWGTGTFHISGGNYDDAERYERCYRDVDQKVKKGEIPQGQVVLQPKHRKPYLGLAMRAFRAHKIKPWRRP